MCLCVYIYLHARAHPHKNTHTRPPPRHPPTHKHTTSRCSGDGDWKRIMSPHIHPLFCQKRPRISWKKPVKLWKRPSVLHSIPPGATLNVSYAKRDPSYVKRDLPYVKRSLWKRPSVVHLLDTSRWVIGRRLLPPLSAPVRAPKLSLFQIKVDEDWVCWKQTGNNYTFCPRKAQGAAHDVDCTHLCLWNSSNETKPRIPTGFQVAATKLNHACH